MCSWTGAISLRMKDSKRGVNSQTGLNWISMLMCKWRLFKMNPAKHYHPGKRDHTVTVRRLSKTTLDAGVKWHVKHCRPKSLLLSVSTHYNGFAPRPQSVKRDVNSVTAQSAGRCCTFTATLWEGCDLNVGRLGRNGSQITSDLGGCWMMDFTHFIFNTKTCTPLASEYY